MNEYFESVFTREEDRDLIYFNDFARLFFTEETAEPFHYSGPTTANSISEIDVQMDQVRKLLKNLNTNKTMGPDRMHARILRELAEEITAPLTHIFNSSIRSGKVPDDWRLALVTAVHKKGSRSMASNYRPISLTSQICKLLEKIIRNNIIEFLEGNGLICLEQHGFRKARSCLTNLLETLEDWTRWDDDKADFDVIYLDFKKAFDSVPHGRLICKLNKLGFQGSLLNWIEDFLSHRKQKAVVNGVESGWRPVSSGVPQGSVIGPLLFICFINDLPSVVMESTCKVFADDTKVYSKVGPETTPKLQDNLNAMNSWSEDSLLDFNAEKCVVMHFGKSNPNHDYYMNNVKLKVAKTEKDLGVIIDDALSFKEHVKRSLSKANQALGIVKRTFNYLNTELFKNLYVTFIRPHLEYCVQAWSPHLRGEIEELEKFQRRATKTVPALEDLPYEERLEKLGLTTLEERRARGDLIETFKILNDYENVDKRKFFENRVYGGDIRGHRQMLQKHQVNKEKRRNFFSQRVIDKWNSLQEIVIESTTVNQFKNRLDKRNA